MGSSIRIFSLHFVEGLHAAVSRTFLRELLGVTLRSTRRLSHCSSFFWRHQVGCTRTAEVCTHRVRCSLRAKGGRCRRHLGHKLRPVHGHLLWLHLLGGNDVVDGLTVIQSIKHLVKGREGLETGRAPPHTLT